MVARWIISGRSQVGGKLILPDLAIFGTLRPADLTSSSHLPGPRMLPLPRASYVTGWLLLLAVTGCHIIPPTRNAETFEILQNPLHVPPCPPEFVWDQLIDVLDDYFRIGQENRVKRVGNILTEGRVDTVPQSGSTYFEPWRKDSTPGFERLHATLQSVRRRAVARVTPTAGGYLIDIAVYKELEDVDRPEQSTVGSATLRNDGTIIRQEDRSQFGAATLGWIPQGRDVSLEQRILSDLRARLTQAHPTQPPPHH